MMRNIKKLGKILKSAEQKLINGGTGTECDQVDNENDFSSTLMYCASGVFHVAFCHADSCPGGSSNFRFCRSSS